MTAYGVAEDLGLLEPPAQAAPAPSRRPPASRGRAGPPRLTFPPATCGCTAAGAGPTGLPWSVLAAIGKVESDHGRARLPGVRSGCNCGRGVPGRCRSAVCRGAGPATPGPAMAAMTATAAERTTRAMPSRPRPVTCVDRGARRRSGPGDLSPTTTRWATWPRSSSLARRYARGGGRR